MRFKMAVVYWFVEGLMILSIYFGSLLFGLCIYVSGCELIVLDPMPFNNLNSCFISQKKNSYVEKKEENHAEQKKKKKGQEKENKRKKRKTKN